jgi:hypothetical protein
MTLLLYSPISGLLISGSPFDTPHTRRESAPVVLPVDRSFSFARQSGSQEDTRSPPPFFVIALSLSEWEGRQTGCSIPSSPVQYILLFSFYDRIGMENRKEFVGSEWKDGDTEK